MICCPMDNPLGQHIVNRSGAFLHFLGTIFLKLIGLIIPIFTLE